jgi:hypothetical protein
MAAKKPKTDYQKRKAAKTKAETETRQLSEFESLSDRHASAMDTHSRIAAYAHGKRPELLSMPEELSGTPLGGQFMTPRSLPDPADEPIPSLATMIQYDREGVDIGSPMAMLRRTYGAPPPVPSSSGGFMGHTRVDRKRPANDLALASALDKRTRELATNSAFAKFQTENNLTTDSTSSDVINAMVDTRKAKFEEGNAVNWYEGDRIGTTDAGHPQYAEGDSPALIKRYARGAGLDPSDLRRSVAMTSPKATWVTEDNEYPNLEAAMMGMHAGATTGMDEFTVGRRVARATGGGALPENIRKAWKQSKGWLPRGWEAIKAAQSSAGGVATPKQSNFDKGLSSPYGPDGSYSPSIAAEKSQAYTSDTHDLGVAGIKTGKVGGKNAAEEWLGSVGGQDITIASAQIATAELFNDHYNRVKNSRGHDAAEAWAEAHAHHYTPNKAQSTWWVGERD